MVIWPATYISVNTSRAVPLPFGPDPRIPDHCLILDSEFCLIIAKTPS